MTAMSAERVNLGSASGKERPSAREAWRPEAAETLRVVGEMCKAMGDALDEDDGIAGALAGMGLANNLPALPAHIRHTFMEYLDDEAAAGLRAEIAYFAEMDHRASRVAGAQSKPESGAR